jgi:Spy/CpxP family protein refolding chaperone
MNHRSLRMTAALFVLSAFVGFGATYAWQAQRPTQLPPPGNPARALGGWLRLMPEQVEQLAEVDPGFAADRARLETALAEARETLARLFENASATDEQILEQVERVIDAHDALERRVAQYLVALRPHLGQEQRNRLFQRCAEGVRSAGGMRWRHGWRGGREETDLGAHEPGRGRGRGRGQGPPWRHGRPGPGSRPASQPSGEQP